METECVLYGNEMRFVWKRNAFYGKMEGVLWQNEMRVVSKRLPEVAKPV
jgi:hypothetical protein